MNILVCNAGSSSLKLSIYSIGKREDGAFELVPMVFESEVFRGNPFEDVQRAFSVLLEKILFFNSGHLLLTAVGHRIVHGGPIHQTVPLTAEVCDTIARYAPFAPLHNPLALRVIELSTAVLPKSTPQFAVFDTAFHASLPRVAAIYPGPLEWEARGFRRFGFHGISHAVAAQRAAELLDRPLEELGLITCHLGNGSSLAAVDCGRSVDTTMGFTPLEGLMMGSRSGTIDPGLLLYLLRSGEYTLDTLEHTLLNESGLKGISRVSSDLREVTSAANAGNMAAEFAIELFIHRLAREFGGMLGSLTRLDGVVFTGGIGENSARIREGLVKRFAWLGMEIDPECNREATPHRRISTPSSSVELLVVKGEEERAIAAECLRAILNP